MRTPAVSVPDIQQLADGVRAGNRSLLARAITLTESRKAGHAADARQLLQALLPHSGHAIRIGITGVPGVGKSTLIDQFGSNLTALGHKVAVLTVDPSSSRSGGSILGDKTRMTRLAIDPNAYIRPSPAAGALGGVAARTREAMLITEAAGFDVILVETVGVGQSETAVADMVDLFLLLLLPGAGDDLQGLKKGIIELADIIAINKAEGEAASRARTAVSDYRAALHILVPASPDWTPPVLTISGLANQGLDTLWSEILRYREVMTGNGSLLKKRSRQQVHWMRSMISDRFHDRFTRNPTIRAAVQERETAVAEGRLTPGIAADEIAAMLGI
jgi:LAO/AO transport system kinase